MKQQKLEIVKLLATQKNSSFTRRDVHGFTPLYIAVKMGAPEMTEILCDVSPLETLYMENSVGDTILETSTQVDFFNRMRTEFRYQSRSEVQELDCDASMVTQSRNWNWKPQSVQDREQRIPQLQAAIKQLLEDGHLVQGTKISTELSNFVTRLEADLEQAKEEEKESNKEKPTNEVTVIPVATFYEHQKTAEHIQNFAAKVGASNIRRDLIHILDVHKSIDRQKPATRMERADDNGLEPEQNEQDSQMKQSLLCQRYNYANGPFNEEFS